MAEQREKTPKRLGGFGTVVKIGRGIGERFGAETFELYWWRNKAIGGFWFFFLVSLNFYQVHSFFGQEFTYSFSAPLVPFLVEMISAVFSLPHGLAVSTVILTFYLFGPLTLYFLVKEITGRLLPGIFAAFLFSSPLFKSRLLAIFFHDDGAHIVGLTLIPLVAYLVLRFLRNGSFSFCIFASLGMTLVALTSPFSLFICLVFLIIITSSEMLLNKGRLKLFRLITVLGLTIGFSAFWYNPDFTLHVFLSRQGKEMMTTLFNLLPISFFIVPVLGTFGFLLFSKKPFLQPLFIALGLSIVFYLFSFAGRLASSFFVSYPDRYLPELGFSLSFLAGIIVTHFFDFLRTGGKIGRFELKMVTGKKLAGLLLVFIFMPLVFFLLRKELTMETSALLEGEKDLGAIANDMVGIGELRGQSGGLARFLGYFITVLTVGVVGYLGISSKLKVQS